MCVFVEAFWVVRMGVGERVLLSSSGQRPDVLLNIRLYAQHSPPPQCITNPECQY